MLDWTTSFLSDETIINPELGVCQTVSIGIPSVVVCELRILLAVGSSHKKKPRILVRGLTKNQPKPRQLPRNPESTLLLPHRAIRTPSRKTIEKSRVDSRANPVSGRNRRSCSYRIREVAVRASKGGTISTDVESCSLAARRACGSPGPGCFRRPPVALRVSDLGDADVVPGRDPARLALSPQSRISRRSATTSSA